MKRLFTLVLLCNIVNSSLNAQIILTQTQNEPVAGDIQVWQRYDSVVPLPRNTGLNQTWNFSSIVQSTVTVYNGTTTYMPVSSVPAYSLFSSATIVAKTGLTEYEFYKSANSPTLQLELIGRYSGGWRIDSMKNSKIDNTWPVAYGYSSVDTYSGNMLGGSLIGQNDGTVTTTAIGSGTLILPGGYQLDNALQVKSVDYYVQTVSSPTPATNYNFTTISYYYYHAISKFPVVTIIDQKSSLGDVVPDYSNVFYTRPSTLGILERMSEFDFSIYPNPATKNFSVSLSNTKNESCLVQVYDVAGKIVWDKYLGSSREIKENVSVSNLPAGAYFVKIGLGNKASFKKLILE